MKLFQFIFFFQKGNCQIIDNVSTNGTLLTSVSVPTGSNVLKCAKPNEFRSIEVRGQTIFPRGQTIFPTKDSVLTLQSQIPDSSCTSFGK